MRLNPELLYTPSAEFSGFSPNRTLSSLLVCAIKLTTGSIQQRVSNLGEFRDAVKHNSNAAHYNQYAVHSYHPVVLCICLYVHYIRFILLVLRP